MIPALPAILLETTAIIVILHALYRDIQRRRTKP